MTNAEFKKFLDATHYHPKDDLNFLHDWKNGTYPDGWANKPVTWVSLEDARAYAIGPANGYLMNGNGNMRRKVRTARLYPWGNEWRYVGCTGAGQGPDHARTGRRGRPSRRGQAPSG